MDAAQPKAVQLGKIRESVNATLAGFVDVPISGGKEDEGSYF